MKFIFLIILFVCLNAYCQTPIFFGGTDDGFASKCLVQEPYFSSFVFSGGEADGSADDCCINQDKSVDIFYGGSEDGYTNMCYIEGVLSVSGMFTGGNSEGFDVLCYSQYLNVSNLLYGGGVSDGFDLGCFRQTSLVSNSLYLGGDNDGLAQYCFLQELEVGSFIYNGADNDGADVNCFEQDIQVTSNHFYGGLSGGYSSYCYRQADYLVSLPIELVSFEAIELQSEMVVELLWETASELNNDYFVVERSRDAFDWEEVGVIDGAGNSSVLLSYITVDDNPYPGTSFYRLKQIDFDGEYTYSFVESVNLEMSEENFNELLIYPNPATSLMNFQFDLFQSDDLTLYIYDINGVRILEKTVSLDGGRGLYTVNDLYKFSAGTYLVVISDGDDINVRQKVVVK